MIKAKEILRLHHTLELSQREIAKATGCSLGTVSKVLQKAKSAGVEYPIRITNKELVSLLYPPVIATNSKLRTEPDLLFIHREMQRKGVTLTLLWEEYKSENPDGLMFTQFCQRYRSFRKQNSVYMRRIYKAGERMMVDWAGLTMEYTDTYGMKHSVYLFVADLPASSYIYTEPFRDMKLSSWIDGHVHTFEDFGGVPRIVVPDNTKTAVTKVNYYDPKLNRTYREMATHYNTAIIPARPRKPRDKAPVETAVQIIERRIIAKLRNRQFLSFDELYDAVKKELDIINSKPFQKIPSNRKDTFLEIEQKELQKLPRERYEYAEWKTAKAAFDYHVQFDKYYYSIPYIYAGKHVEIRAASRTIEIFFNHERIAVHKRTYQKSKRYITCTEHMPQKHKAVSEWTPERFISWAQKTGANAATYIRWLLESREHPEQAFKTCAGILRLASKVPKSRMEEACEFAIERNIYSYKYFDILLRNLETANSAQPIIHANVRGSHYYGGDSNA